MAKLNDLIREAREHHRVRKLLRSDKFELW